jgi:hypothetical protein
VKGIQVLHVFLEAIQILLNHLHRLQMLESCLLFYLVLSLIGIILEVPHVGYVAYIPDFILKICKVTEQHVECHSWTGMAKMRMAVNRRAADIHSYKWGMKRFEEFLFAGEAVIDGEVIIHELMFIRQK